MTFNLNIIKKEQFTGELTKTISTENGVELMLVVTKDEAFESAFAEVQSVLQSQDGKVTKDKLKRQNQGGINQHEALLYLIGEYNIKSWNVTVDDKALEINGDNFLMLIENAFDSETVLPFITQVVNEFTELLKVYGEKVSEIKKKHLNSTSGKSKSEN